MTATFSPISTVPASMTRDAPAPGTAARSAPAASVESMQALRPVDPGSRAADLRLPTGRDRPVGPPPAFDINVLDEIREHLTVVEARNPVENGSRRESTEPGPRTGASYETEQAIWVAEAAAPNQHRVNLSV